MNCRPPTEWWRLFFQLRLSVFHSVHRGVLYRPLAHPLHASKGQIIIINQLKSIYNSLFEDSYSHPIHTCFLIIARNGFNLWQMNVGMIDLICHWSNVGKVDNVGVKNFSSKDVGTFAFEVQHSTTTQGRWKTLNPPSAYQCDKSHTPDST